MTLTREDLGEIKRVVIGIVDSKVDSKIEELALMIAKGFEGVHKQFELIDKRFQEIDKRFQEIDKNFEAIDKRFDIIESRLDHMDARLAMLERDVAEIRQRLSMRDEVFEDLLMRVQVIEKQLGIQN